MQRLTRDEWETHICIDAVNEVAIIDTSIPKDINKLKKLGYPIITENFYDDGSTCNIIFSVPRKAMSFRNMAVLNMPMSEKRKQALAKARANTMK